MIFVDNADQKTLEHHLRNSNTLALFWIAHAKNQSGGNATSSIESILDINNNNISQVFKNIHPNIKFVSMVSCHSTQIIDMYKKQGHYLKNKNLKFVTYNSTIGLRKGIKNSIYQSSKILSRRRIDRDYFYGEFTKERHYNIIYPHKKYLYLETNKNVPYPEKQGIEILVTPENEISSPILITIGNEYLGSIYPEDTNKRFIIPKTILNQQDRIKLIFTSPHTLLSIDDHQINTTFEIHSPNLSLDITYFVGPDQKLPFGKYKNIYYLNRL